MELPLDVQVQQKRLDVVEHVVAVPCSCEVVRLSIPFVRFVLMLQMQHLRGIHTYREEVLRLRTAKSMRSSRCGRWRLPKGVDCLSPVAHPTYL